MFAIFSCPKPFHGHFETIQRNAIRSWLSLKPCPQIILFGAEDGTAEICAELSIFHVPDIERNEFGTPLLNDIFKKAERHSGAEVLCYINADIVLTSGFSEAVELVARRKRRFLMGGRPWNLDIGKEMSFCAGWEQGLVERVSKEGQLRHERCCDFFAYPRGLWGDLPPFAVGRAFFDNALLYRARRIGAALVDATHEVITIHQNHTYPSHLGGEHYLDNPEAQQNVVLAKGPSRLLTWKSATHFVNRGQLRFNLRGYLRIFGPESPITKFVRRWLLALYVVLGVLSFYEAHTSP